MALTRDRHTQDPPAERDYVLVEFPLADDAICAVRTEELRAAVVAHMPRPLTDAEWQRYGGRPSEL